MKEDELSFTETGSWNDIVEFGEKVYISARQTIEEMDVSRDEEQTLRDSLYEFDSWRPKIEDYDKEISEKTAESVAIDSPDDDDIDENMDGMEKNMKEGIEAVEENNPRKAGRKWKGSTEHLAIASSGKIRQILNSIEQFIYKNLMTVISPYYFDNELFNASLYQKSRYKYVFEVNPNNDTFREIFRQELRELDEISRWHIDHNQLETDTQKETELSSEPSDKRSKKQKEDDIENERTNK